MTFYVTQDFKVYDTTRSFRRLTPMQRANLMWNARDLWEANFGPRKGSPLPEVVAEVIEPKDTLGAVTP
jgi:hypothetical protein